MYTSDINTQKRRMGKISLAYLLISLFCALFGYIYELFSHEVYSSYMIYAFIFPLAGGALPFLVFSLFSIRLPIRLSLNVYNCGIATVTTGSIMAGILEIYGTTNEWIRFYWYIGFGLIAIGILLYIIQGAAIKTTPSGP